MNSNKADLFLLLSSGGKYSVLDIMKRMNISNPKNMIQDLIAFGVNVHEDFVKTRNGGYKRYWIDF